MGEGRISKKKLTKRDGAVSQKVTENYWGGGGPPKSYQQWWREGRVGHKVTKSDAGGGSQKVMGRVVGLCSQPKVTPYLLSSIDLPIRHKQYLCELLITRTGLFDLQPMPPSSSCFKVSIQNKKQNLPACLMFMWLQYSANITQLSTHSL